MLDQLLAQNKVISYKYLELTFKGNFHENVHLKIKEFFGNQYLIKHLLVFKQEEKLKIFLNYASMSNPTIRFKALYNRCIELTKIEGCSLEFLDLTTHKNLESHQDSFLNCLKTWDFINTDKIIAPTNVKKELPKILNMLDAFSGIGGFSLALKTITQSVGYCESSEVATAILQENMKRQYIHSGPIFPDIKTLVIPQETHLVTAGTPCQGFSLAGSQAGFDHPGSNLFFALVAALDQPNKPPVLFLENVPQILKELDQITDILCGQLGYALFWTVCPASETVGAPHKRNRWYAIAIQHNYTWELPLIQNPSFYSFHKNRMPPRTNAGILKKESQCRSMLLGNSVVPPVITYVWNLLGTGAKTIEKNPSKLDNKAILAVLNSKKKFPSHGCCMILNNQKQTYYFKSWEILLKSLDPSISLDFNVSPNSNRYQDTLEFSQLYSPANKAPSILKKKDTLFTPVQRKLWGTVLHSEKGAPVYLTARTVNNLWPQVKFEKNTINREAVINPNFVEFLMGYPLDYTLLPITDWSQNFKTLNTYKT